MSELGKTTLPSGIRVVTERMPGARSVTIGFWVAVGGRDEPLELAGASHFLEHLFFKGTAERGAQAIAESVDALGGEMNAFTAREHTAYYLRLPAEQLGFGLDLLTHVLSAPAFRAEEIDAERQVILEEIWMNEDDPDDKVHTLLAEAVFPDHPLGREVLGTEASIEAMTRDQIAGFFGHHYRPRNLVVAAAGDLDHDVVVDGVAACFAGADAGDRPERSAPKAVPLPVIVEERTTEQAHVSLAWRAIDHFSEDRTALGVGNHALGGGMSSRLFQEVREKRGLAYSVFSSPSLYSDAGVLSLYVGTAPNRLDESMAVIGDVVSDLTANGITPRELEVAKGYLEGSLVLGSEDSGSRMARIASSEVARGEVLTLDEQIARIRAVTIDDANRVLSSVLAGPRTLAAVGPFDATRFS